MTKPFTVLAETYGRTSAPIAVEFDALITQIGAVVIAAANTIVQVVVADAPMVMFPAFDRLAALTAPFVPVPQAPLAMVGTLPVPTLTFPVDAPTVSSPDAVEIAGTLSVPVNVGFVENPGFGYVPDKTPPAAPLGVGNPPMVSID